MKSNLILIVEDDDEERERLRQTLQDHGYAIEESRTWQNGVLNRPDELADLAIVDVVLPQKDGIESIVQLRAHHPKLQILALSSGEPFHPDNCMAKARKVGANRALAKPYTSEELIAEVERLLPKRR